MTQHSLFSEEEHTKSNWFEDALTSLGVDDDIGGWPDTFGEALANQKHRTKTDGIRVLSLFAGGGGLDIGFHDAGFEIVECNELEESFAATLRENNSVGGRLEGANIVCCDINEYDPNIKDIDFIIGGPPCQTFSAAGARAAGVNGIDDDRGNLFKQYVRILKKLKPKGFLFENVYRIVGAQGGKPWRLITEAFSEAGYKLYWRILDAADFGVPQFRERLIIVGLRNGEFLFPAPTHGPDSSDNRRYYSAGRALENVTSLATGNPINGRHGHLLRDIPPGLNYSFYTDRMGHPTPLFGWRSKFSDYLYKADPDTPVRTIKAQGGQYTGPFHWDSRTFTVEELKRLQTFPDDYSVVGSRLKAIHQLGNSVPPQLARILAIGIAKQVFKRELPFEVELLPVNATLNFRKRKSKLTKLYTEKAREAINKSFSGKRKVQKITSLEEKKFCKLHPNLRLDFSSADDWDYYFHCNIDDGIINLSVWDQEKNGNVNYSYVIEPAALVSPNDPVKKILVNSYSYDKTSITAIWKYLEMLIRTNFHKDDLVQFFGYYQYSNKFNISFNLLSSELKGKNFWKVLSEVSQGRSVGCIRSLQEIASLYEVNEKHLISELKNLKKLGYEIRSHNTNKQISDGHLLIPYSFPTLSERSLQRLTEL